LLVSGENILYQGREGFSSDGMRVAMGRVCTEVGRRGVVVAGIDVVVMEVVRSISNTIAVEKIMLMKLSARAILLFISVR
jgi:hypothetical protein